jgi:hypothetical protein
MIPQDLFDVADKEICELAAAASSVPLLAGAADPEVGLEVLADLLAHEIAASHRLMLRLATAAQDVMDWTKKTEADPRQGQAHAARLSAAAGRLLEEVRQGLVLLRRLRPGAAGEGRWLALAWGEARCSAEELARRLAAAKAAKAANEPAKPQIRPSARAEEARAQALDTARMLARAAKVEEIAAVAADADQGPAFLARLFAHELGTVHTLAMRLKGQAEAALARATAAAQEPADCLSLVSIAARLGERYRRGVATLARLNRGAFEIAGHVWAGVDGGPGATAGHGVQPSPSAGHGVDPANSGQAAA